MVNITYLLGAGASYNSIPIVSEFGDVLKYHHAVILNKIGDTKKKQFSGLITYLDRIEQYSNQIPEFTTIDTIAKYYFIKNGANSKEYRDVKSTLALFFFIEQRMKHLFLDEQGRYVRPKNLGLGFTEKAVFRKEHEVDPRYRNLLMTLLEGKMWPKNVKIITWNYDFQLELACQEIDSELVRFYPNSHKIQETEINIYHLNGIALVDQDESYQDENSGVNLLSITEHSLEDLAELAQRVYADRLIHNSISYSWDSAIKWNQLKDHLSYSQILVIIGYSFPFFNRKVDAELFNKLGKLEKIYFQDPNFDGQFLYSQFDLQSRASNSRLSGAGDKIPIEHILETRFHYVPPEY